MGANSKIEWTDHTWNPVVGCTKVSPACDNCYAEAWAKRTGQSQLWNGARRRTSAANWRQPLKWDRDAARDGVRRRVFCASLADVFDNQWDSDWREAMWRVIDQCRNLDWLLLTKRPQNIAKMLPTGVDLPKWPWPHVWLGATAENQEEMVRRRISLLSVPAAVRFLSCEPLLHPVWLPALDGYPQVDWVIVGGESGAHAREMHPNWARSLRDQCAEMGIAFFMKQLTKKAPIPPDLMVRQFPRSG